MRCQGLAGGWKGCPWALAGSTVKPLYEQAKTPETGLRLVRVLMALDSLYTHPKAEAPEDLQVLDTADEIGECYCPEGPAPAKLSPEQVEDLRAFVRDYVQP